RRLHGPVGFIGWGTGGGVGGGQVGAGRANAAWKAAASSSAQGQDSGILILRLRCPRTLLPNLVHDQAASACSRRVRWLALRLACRGGLVQHSCRRMRLIAVAANACWRATLG